MRNFLHDLKIQFGIVVAFMIVMIIYVLCSGCANIKIEREMPDGSILRAEYTRWLNQSIEGLQIKTPEGYELSFDRQNSEVPTINLNLNGLEVKNEVPTN